MQDNKDDLKARGLDVADWITELNALKDNVVVKGAEQDTARAVSKEKTREATDANRLAYKTASTRLDAVIGVLGKDTPLAKQAARLRSSLIRQSKSRTENKSSS